MVSYGCSESKSNFHWAAQCLQCRVANLGWGSGALGGKVIGAIRERGQESGTRGDGCL